MTVPASVSDDYESHIAEVRRRTGRLHTQLCGVEMSHRGIGPDLADLVKHPLADVDGEPTAQELADLKHHYVQAGRHLRAAQRVLRPYRDDSTPEAT